MTITHIRIYWRVFISLPTYPNTHIQKKRSMNSSKTPRFKIKRQNNHYKKTWNYMSVSSSIFPCFPTPFNKLSTSIFLFTNCISFPPFLLTVYLYSRHCLPLDLFSSFIHITLFIFLQITHRLIFFTVYVFYSLYLSRFFFVNFYLNVPF